MVGVRADFSKRMRLHDRRPCPADTIPMFCNPIVN